MTALSHLDPNFGTVAAIEAMNEPIMDASQTPGLGGCMEITPFLMTNWSHKSFLVQVNFVQTVRAVELALGLAVPGITHTPSYNAGNVSAALSGTSTLSSIFNAEVRQVLLDAVPILVQVSEQLSLNTVFSQNGLGSHLKARPPLVTTYVLTYTCFSSTEMKLLKALWM